MVVWPIQLPQDAGSVVGEPQRRVLLRLEVEAAHGEGGERAERNGVAELLEGASVEERAVQLGEVGGVSVGAFVRLVSWVLQDDCCLGRGEVGQSCQLKRALGNEFSIAQPLDVAGVDHAGW